MHRLISVSLVACGLIGCTEQATLNSSSPSSMRVHVSQSEFGDSWPLTVDSGEIECIDTYFMVFRSGGETYALNGLAKGQGYADITPIWKDNPKIPGAKMDISPLTMRGLALRDGVAQTAPHDSKEVEANSVPDGGEFDVASIQSQVDRIQKLIVEVRNPAVELNAVDVVQEREDLIIRGKGRNVGECVLASLKLRAKVGAEVDGILVEMSDKPSFEVPMGGEFSFELNFYDTPKHLPVKLWFVLDDLSDDNFENDPTVPLKLRGGTLQSEILIDDERSLEWYEEAAATERAPTAESENRGELP